MRTLSKGVYHVPIMAEECIKLLNIKANGLYLDGTLGGAGHTQKILENGGRVIAFDLDPQAIAFASELLSKNPDYIDKYTLINDNFKNADTVLTANSIDLLDGAILDLGISSHQIDEPERGFSYMQDAKLDMRMDTNQKRTAYEVVNNFSEEELADIIFTYGEERFSRRIAKKIVDARKNNPINSTLQLSSLISSCVPFIKGAGNPAKRTFQALRIFVNGELDGLSQALIMLINRLKTGARLAVITFHSLEDRLVKKTFKTLSESCICPKSFPICVCEHKKSVELLTPKGIKPSLDELEKNKRAKSAILRCVEKK